MYQDDFIDELAPVSDLGFLLLVSFGGAAGLIGAASLVYYLTRRKP